MVPLISVSLDRRLTVVERVKLRLHLFVCTWCDIYLKQLKSFSAILQLKSNHSDSSPVVLTPEARARIIEAIRPPDQLPKSHL
jgi:hypothetical protein